MSHATTKPRNFTLITNSCCGFDYDPVYVPCEGKPAYWTRDKQGADLRPASREEAQRFAQKFGRPKAHALPKPVSRRDLAKEMREREEELLRFTWGAPSKRGPLGL